MKACVIVGVLLFSNFAFANGFLCHAQKSIMKYNPDTGTVELRRAISPQFTVTSAEHEDPKTFEFVDESSRPWGAVQIVTGSHLVEADKWFYVNATVTKADGVMIGFLLLKMPISGSRASASTLIFDESEDMPPSLTVSCSQATQ